MSELFSDIPEALENNYNFPLRCNFRPLFSKPISYQILALKKMVMQMKSFKKNSLEGFKR